MKKILALLLVLAVSGGASLFAQDAPAEPAKPFSVDAAGGLSFGLFDKLGTVGDVDLSVVATILSIRAGIDGDLLFHVNDTVAVGPQLGLYVLQYTVTSGASESTVTFIDVPVRVVAKVGNKGASIQPYLGYFVSVNTLSNFSFPPAGVDVGARAVLGNFFIEGGYVIGSTPWTRIAFGFQASDLFSF
jgi:hypothetical protein